jgi:hypothetical protein
MRYGDHAMQRAGNHANDPIACRRSKGCLHLAPGPQRRRVAGAGTGRGGRRVLTPGHGNIPSSARETAVMISATMANTGGDISSERDDPAQRSHHRAVATFQQTTGARFN